MCVCVCESWKSLNQQNHMCFLEHVSSQKSKEKNFPRRYLSSPIATDERRSRDFVFLGASRLFTNSKSARDVRTPHLYHFSETLSTTSDIISLPQRNASVGRKAVNKRFFTSLFCRRFCSRLMEEFKTRKGKEQNNHVSRTSMSA